MIATTVLRELAELDNADLETAVARFIRAAHMIALENDPRTASGEASVHTGKPGSRAPGRQMCPDKVRRLESLARKAYRKAASTGDKDKVKRLVELAQEADNKAAEIRREREHRIESMGGITIAAPNGVAVNRRETRITTHLHGKLVEAYRYEGTD